MRRYKDKESFVTLSNLLHNGKYDYSQFEYKGKDTKGQIICPIHGSFFQTPNTHVRKNRPSGCPLCAKESRKTSFEDFLKLSRKIHGDKYEYDKSSYNGMNQKLKVYCKKHKFWFSCSGNNHTNKSNPTGCPKCAIENVTNINRKSFAQFIEEARKIHADKYEYDEESYFNANSKTKIYCKKHNFWFWQTPHSHLNGHGCPKCNYSKLEWNVEKLLLQKHINFIPQHTFEWLKGKRKTFQYIDFYLPDYNIAIECQGEQHFKPVEKFGGNKTYIKIVERDKRKKILCEEHNVRLFYINYNENLEEKLYKILKCNEVH